MSWLSISADILTVLVSGFIAYHIYSLQKRLTFTEKIRHMEAVRSKIEEHLFQIRNLSHFSPMSPRVSTEQMLWPVLSPVAALPIKAEHGAYNEAPPGLTRAVSSAQTHTWTCSRCAAATKAPEAPGTGGQPSRPRSFLLGCAATSRRRGIGADVRGVTRGVA